MASHKSAEKCIRKTERRTAMNKNRMSRIRTFIKKAEELMVPNAPKEKLTEALVQAEREIKRGVTKGVIHRNTAARKVSRLVKRAKAFA